MESWDLPKRYNRMNKNSPKFKNSTIKNVHFGKNIVVIKPVNLYGCIIGESCFVGPFVEIQSDVEIGNNTKIQSHSFICSKVNIGNECFIGHGVMFINDKFKNGGPAKGEKDLWQFTKVGNLVSIGSNSTILPVTICDKVVIGAGSVVTKNIDKPGVYAGNPASLISKC